MKEQQSKKEEKLGDANVPNKQESSLEGAQAGHYDESSMQVTEKDICK